MKKVHEDRIEYLTSLKTKDLSHMVFYTPNIGSNIIRINPENAINAVLPEFYPAERTPIELHCTNSDYKDNEEKYWEFEKDQLVRKYETKIRTRIAKGEINHLSIFAIAPQPLLIELGRQISDIQPAEIYQKHREPDTWGWQKEPQTFEYIIHEPKKVSNKIALNLSLSGTIDNDRITSILGDDVSIWTITIAKPDNDFIKSRKQVEIFRQTMRSLFDRIKIVHGQNNGINVFPACPVSIAIEIGRVWMPKADLPLIIYDQNNTQKKFIHAIDIV